MKLDKKNIIMLALAGVIVIALMIVLSGKKDGEITDFSLSPTPTALPGGSPEITLVTSPTPKPELIAKEANGYDYWFQVLDPDARVLGIYDECSYIVPSNVAYKNNTQVMLDNTRSEQNHVLKIGIEEYVLGAGKWQLVTLSSSTVPVNLPIFCKGIELGQIELN